MNLNRPLIKSQAKALIKGQVWALFLLTAVVMFLAGGFNISININKNTSSLNDFSSYEQESEEFGASPFDIDEFDDYIERNFSATPSPVRGVITVLAGVVSIILGLIQFFMLPLSVTLIGVYIMLVHGNKLSLGDSFKYTFKFTFNNTYWNKLLCEFVQGIIIVGMSLLFIIPGIIFYYRYYFASTVLADNPNLSARQAVKLSIKMTDGYKGELLAFDLSFLGWVFLFPITLGLISIYTVPYYMTAKTLYYENFKARAIANGVLTQHDFEANTFDNENNQSVNSQYYQSQQAQANPNQAGQQYNPAYNPAYQQAQPVNQVNNQPPVYQQDKSYYQEPVWQRPAQPQQPEAPKPTPVLSVEEPISTNNEFGTGFDNNYYNTDV